MKNRENIYLGLLFLAVPLWLFKGGLLTGNVFNAFDTLTLDVPFRMFAQEMFFKYHQMPFWLPGILAGIPLIDSTNLMYFYPPALLTMITGIPAWATVTPFVILHMLLSAAGTCFFLKQIGLNKAGSVFGAMAFMTSGIMVSYVSPGHLGNIIAASFIPWIFYFFRRGHDEDKLFWHITAGLCLAMQVLCIGMQVMAYTFMAAAAYLIYLMGKKLTAKQAANTVLILVSAVLACVLFSAPQFFASIKYLKYSWRWDNTYELFTSWSFNPRESLTFLLPQFFGVMGKTYWGYTLSNSNTFFMGILPFLLLPAAFMQGKNRGTAVFFGLCAVVFLILGFGGHTPLYKVFYHIPLLNSFRAPNRFLYIFTFCVITLSAIGLSNLIETAGNKKEYAKKWFINILAAAGSVTAVLVLLLVTGGMRAIVSGMFQSINSYPVNDDGLNFIVNLIWQDTIIFAAVLALLLSAAFLYSGRKIKSALIIAGILCAAHFIDIARVEKYFINYVQIKSVMQEDNTAVKFLKTDASIYRAMEPENKSVPNVNLYFGIEFLNGYHGFSPAKYLRMSYDGSLNNLKVDRMLNVKYYLRQNDDAPKGMVKVFDDSLKIYEDPAALPRFYLAGDIVNLTTEDDAYNYITQGDFIPGQAVVSGHPEMAASAGVSAGRVIPDEYGPNRIKLGINADRDGMLVISNFNYGSWKAVLDKKEVPIYNVNYLNSGIAINKGVHTAELYFDGWYVYAGIFTALFTLLGYILFYFYDIKGMWRYHGKRRK